MARKTQVTTADANTDALSAIALLAQDTVAGNDDAGAAIVDATLDAAYINPMTLLSDATYIAMFADADFDNMVYDYVVKAKAKADASAARAQAKAMATAQAKMAQDAAKARAKAMAGQAKAMATAQAKMAQDAAKAVAASAKAQAKAQASQAMDDAKARNAAAQATRIADLHTLIADVLADAAGDFYDGNKCRCSRALAAWCDARGYRLADLKAACVDVDGSDPTTLSVQWCNRFDVDAQGAIDVLDDAVSDYLEALAQDQGDED
jgi:hypothetical protein